jgi:hypothetical protein
MNISKQQKEISQTEHLSSAQLVQTNSERNNNE